MTEIIIDRVTKRFGSFTAIDDLEVRFGDGEVACLLGPSGCGKTTLMRMIAGLESPTSGRILFGDTDVTALSTSRRNVGMVFQYPVMYPTLSVEENILLPMREDRALSARDRERRVEEMLDVLDMRDQRRAYIDELDQGNRQKVAVGRAIARGSSIVLFDEPTTNVEVNAKLHLIRAIKAIIQRTRQTIVYVTHDQTEAMTLADRIALMFGGKISQYDKPHDLYNNPRTEFGGWFMGNPGMNFVPAVVKDGRITAPLLAEPLAAPGALSGATALKLGVRPEWIAMHGTPRPGTVPGVLVDRTVGIAGRYLTRVSFGEVAVNVKTDGRPPVELGGTVHLAARPDRILLYLDGVQVTV